MIPHLAIDHVVIEVNDTNNNPSQFHHMMQMIPLAIVSNASLTFDFLLDVVCPPEESMIAVTSDSIQVLTPYEDAARLIRPNVFLFWLMKGQRVRLRAQSSRGTPHQHARYQVGNAGYRIVPTIRIPERSSSTSSTVLPDLEDQLVASCPKRVFVRLPDDMVDGSSTKVQVDAAYPTLCVNCGACAPFGVTIEPSPQTLMYVESNIVDTPSYVMRRGLEVLRDRVYELLQVSAEWIIREDGVVPNTHILETPLLNMTVAQLLVYELSLLPLVTFHATKITHPLENKTVTRLRVITDEDTRTVQRDIEVVRDTLREAFLSVAERLQEWLDESSSSM